MLQKHSPFHCSPMYLRLSFVMLSFARHKLRHAMGAKVGSNFFIVKSSRSPELAPLSALAILLLAFVHWPAP